MYPTMDEIEAEHCAAGCWTEEMMHKYGIVFVDTTFDHFFGLPALPQLSPDLQPFTYTPNQGCATDETTYQLLHYLELAQFPEQGEANAIDVLIMQLMRVLGYSQGRRICLSHSSLPYANNKVLCWTPTDVTMLCGSQVLLVIQRRSGVKSLNPESRLIASAVAAFFRNNQRRLVDLQLPLKSQMTILGIAFEGTSPAFYRMDISHELTNAVCEGIPPKTFTLVFRHVPQLPHQVHEEYYEYNQRGDYGLLVERNRAVILRHMLAFRYVLDQFYPPNAYADEAQSRLSAHHYGYEAESICRHAQWEVHCQKSATKPGVCCLQSGCSVASTAYKGDYNYEAIAGSEDRNVFYNGDDTRFSYQLSIPQATSS